MTKKTNTINSVFEKQVLKTPYNVALSCQNKTLTYQQLNEQANKIAQFILSRCNIKTDDIIGIYLDRECDMVIAMLGILKVGGAYLPINLSSPLEKIFDIVNDAKPKVIITNTLHAQKISALKNIITIENANNINNFYNHFPDIYENNLAYIIYTSGSTGRAKGVMIEHINVMNTLSFQIENYLNSAQKINFGMLLNYSFDASVSNIFIPLLSGNHLIISPQVDHININDFIELNNINMIIVPSPMLSLLDVNLNTLHTIIIGGEKPNIKIIDQLIDNGKTVIQEYGLTETAITSSYKKLNKNDIKPIQNTEFYVLDENRNPVQEGELYIAGLGVGRGYVNYNSINFMPNWHKDSPYKTLYKTGDFVKRLQNGDFEYLSRQDMQIKINGHRIELEEIEIVLLSHKNTKECAVVVNQDTILAYIVRDVSENNEKNTINNWMSISQIDYANLNLENYKFNINGWISSYTGLAIPSEEMQEWIDNTIDKILKLKPQNILEIGSGSGLIVFNILENCKHYYATDFSQYAIDYTNKIVERYGFSNKISTYCSTADEIPYSKIKKYDLVVINSVIQYFPNLDYLENVINKAINGIERDGKIFIGDVRDYRLLHCFHSSVQNYRNTKPTKADIEYFASRESELLVSPEYFLYLQNINTRISHIEITPKLGIANNEMNKYRYDVVLFVGKTNNNQMIMIHEDQFLKLDLDIVATSKEDIICIKYPNKRIVNEYLEYCAIYEENYDISNEIILSISDIINLANNNGYKVRFYLDIKNDLYFNIIFYKQNNPTILYKVTEHNHKNNLANYPLDNGGYLEDDIDFKNFLSTKLPNYMVPQQYFFIENLPMTANGKIDRKSLINNYFIEKDISFIVPSNDIEVQISQIWSDILGLPVKEISTEREFFDLGGNSLTAIKLVNKINKEIGANINITDIFRYNTIIKCSNYIKKSRDYIKNNNDLKIIEYEI